MAAGLTCHKNDLVPIALRHAFSCALPFSFEDVLQFWLQYKDL